MSVLALALTATVVFGMLALGGESIPIRVGVIYNTSGGLKWLDEPGLQGALLAADQINESGGVLGRELEIVPADGTTDVVKMTDLASELVGREDIVAIAGINEPLHAVAPVRATIKRADGGFLTFAHSEIALAVGKVTQEANVPFVTAGSTLPGLPGQIGDDVFMVAATHQAGATAMARFAWDDLGAHRAWVLVDERSQYAGTMAAAFESTWGELGGEVIGDSYLPGAMIQIPDQIDRLEGLDSEPDVIFIASLQNDGGYLLDQLREAGVDLPVLFADVVDPRYIEAMRGDMKDVFMATHGSLIGDDEAIREFATAYEEAFGKAPESASAMLGYDSLRLIADAIDRAGSAQRDDISRSLAETTDFAALTGDFSYPEGERVPAKPITIVAYQQGEPTVVAEIPSH